MAHLLPLLSALRRVGCDAHLLCLGGGGLARAAAERGLPVEVLPMTTPWDPRVLPALRRRLRGTRWDAVHTHGMRANLPVRLLWGAAERSGAGGVAEQSGSGGVAEQSGSGSVAEQSGVGGVAGRSGALPAGSIPCLFTTVHSDLRLDYSDPLRRRVFPALDRWTRARVDRIVCVSEDLRRRLLVAGVAEEKSLVVRSGLEFEAGAPAQGSDSPSGVASAVWSGPPPAPGTPRVGTVARLVEVKDIDLFLEVMVRVASSAPDVRAAVVGSGPELARLRALSRSLGLDGVVTFPGDVRPGSAVVREFDLFLLTSASEGIPMAVLEAMAAGVAVVATDVGGMKEVVQEGVNGTLVPRGSDRDSVARALADRVLDLLRHPTLRVGMGASARARVQRDFSAEASARVLLDAYSECVAGRRAAAGGDCRAAVGGAASGDAAGVHESGGAAAVAGAADADPPIPGV